MYSNDKDETNSDDDDSKDHFDVVFLIDEISYTDTQLNEIKKEIQAVSEIIFKHSKDVTISIYGLDGSGLTHSTWYGRADNITNVGIMLSHVSHKVIANRYNQVVLSECIDYVIAAHKISSDSAKRPEYGFVYYDPYYLNSDSELVFRFLADSPRTDEYGMKMLELVKSEGTDIDFSTVTASYAEIIGNTSYANNLSEVTNGTFINGTSYTSVVNESIEHIYGKALEEVNVYKLLIATDFEYVNLEKPITEKYIENAVKYGHNYIDISEFDEEDIEDCADTDGDGLWDFQEIKVFKGLTETPENQIIWFEDGKLMLPTVNDMTKEVYKDIYSSEEIDAFREYFAEQYGHNIDSEFWRTPVLPINSHPIKPDTDGDGLNDNVDRAPFHKTEIPEFFKQLIINEVVEYTQIVRLSDVCYICIERISELAKSDFVESYVNENNDISKEDWKIIELGLSLNDDYYGCVASVCVGRDVLYFTAPSDTTTDRVIVMANQEADCHRKAISSSVLEDSKTYQTLIAYSESLSQQQYLENQEFEERISEMFNLNELFELLGFFDGNVIVGSALDGFTNTVDSFYKSACRFLKSLSFDNIKCNVVIFKIIKKEVDRRSFLWYNIKVEICGCGGIGRRARLRIWCPRRAGSSPVIRTKPKNLAAASVARLLYCFIT